MNNYYSLWRNETSQINNFVYIFGDPEPPEIKIAGLFFSEIGLRLQLPKKNWKLGPLVHVGLFVRMQISLIYYFL